MKRQVVHRFLAARVRGALVAGLMLSAAMPVAPAFGQSASASVSGVVTDQTGGALPGVTITIANRSNGVTQTLVSGPEGRYRVVALQPAPYELTAELSGFGTVKRALTLFVGTDATADFRLGVAGLAESITVAAQSPLVEVTKAQPSAVVEASQLQTLPTITRNFLTLSQLLPGSGPTAGTGKFAFTKFGGVADQRNGYTTLIDGGSVDDTDWGSPTINVTQDAVQEFKVFRNQFDAQYGAALTAVVAVVTKSGSNQFSGSGFYFGRDQRLNAKNYFATTKAPFDQTRVGGSLGGPIVKNRTHFFAAGEHLKVNATAIVALPGSNPFSTQENGVFATPSRDDMLTLKVDHQASAAHALVGRYSYDNQSLGGIKKPTFIVDGLRLGANSTDDIIHAHSLVVEDNWVLSSNKVNTLRFHLLKDFLGTVPNSTDLGITRPSFSWGQNNIAPQYFPRNTETLSDAIYINLSAHDLKVGGEVSRVVFPFEAHFNEQGVFAFNTDAPFNAANTATWPFSMTIQKPGFYRYQTYTVGLFAQDDWRVANRVRLNLGMRYDIDTNMRLNDFFEGLIGDPRFPGIERFISKDRGLDLANVQPRAGLTWDTRGNGSFVVRGGFGVYVTRNRPWFDATVQDMTIGGAVIIQDPQKLKFFPDVNAVLGGLSLDAYLAQGGVRSLLMIPDDYRLPRSYNTTGGFAWQINNSTAFTADYVHGYGANQLGVTDRNLPAAGAISATNPRPVPNFSRVTMIENYTKSWYDALETQVRTRVRGANNLQLSYTLSKSWLDGVDFYSTVRGTQRTPQEAGFNTTDTRHNLTASASTNLPWHLQLSGIMKLVSGFPIGRISAGVDLDGDGNTSGDRPTGLPPRVGRGDVDAELAIINAFRTSRGLQPIDKSLLELNMTRAFDLRLTRSVQLGAARRLELFLEMFNVPNFVDLMGGNNTMNAAPFLVRTTARDPRQLQWGARYAF
jgi:carboxypeptidase family protein/TonB-dependent receptor-like protein